MHIFKFLKFKMSALEINKNRAYIRSIEVAITYYIKNSEIIFNFHKTIIKNSFLRKDFKNKKKTCT